MHSTLRYNLTLLISILLVGLLPVGSFAQTSSTSQPLEVVLKQIEKDYGVNVFYQEAWIKDIVGTYSPDGDLKQVLSEALLSTDLSFLILEEQLVILLQAGQKKVLPTYTMTGQVVLENDDSPILGATVILRETGQGISTDLEGRFSVTAEKGNYQLVIKSLNTIDKLLNISLKRDTTFQISVFDKTVELEGVIVTGQSIDENVSKANAGRVMLDLESVKTLPTFMGEVDVTKVIKTLPGVGSVGEGTSGFNVRGGNIDQNLILFDHIPIYNSSHLLGFFSIFNPDVVGNFTLYKGSMPANYGGRLSSLLSVSQKTPSKSNAIISGGIGPVNNRINVELPLIKNRSSLLIGGRYANPAVVLNNFQRQTIAGSNANYADLNLKYHDAISSKDVISFSSYLSTDNFSFSGDTTYHYKVAGLSGEWNHQINGRMTTQLVGFFSDYQAGLLNEEPQTTNEITNGIQNLGLNATFSYYLNDKIVTDIGFNWLYYKIRPGELTPLENSSFKSLKYQNELAFETGWFVNAEYQVNDQLSITGGLRYSTFSNLGSRDEPVFDPTVPKSKSSIIEFSTFSKGSLVRTFGGLEPRLSTNLRINASTSLKAAYALNRQYVHLFSNATASLPTDLWKVSDSNLKPQIGHQYSLGIFKNFSSNMFETSTELFYRDITQLSELRTGAPVLLNQWIEKDLFPGTGRAYGVELYAKKQIGKINGWISYTWSKTERKVDNEFAVETFNQGAYYPANFDIPHNLNISSNFRLSRLWTFSWNFVFQSGRPVTVPQSSFRYTVNNERYYTYLDRNNFRIPDTHRLDLSLTVAGTNKRNSPWENSFTFSMYNVYGRDNPFSVFVDNIDASNSIPRVFQLAVLGSAFPSITFNFKYKGTKE